MQPDSVLISPINKNNSIQSVELRTGIWYHDRPLILDFPNHWQIDVSWPDTPPPLDEQELRDIIESPRGRPPLRELAAGKKRPCIIVDDLSRPTPARAIMPIILSHFEDAGIPLAAIKIVVATGTHGDQPLSVVANKLGKKAMQCQVVVHNDLKNTSRVGKTSFGTAVHVSNAVLDSDLRIGIGGVYPQHTTGFGGGGKLALGILGRASIMGLHYTHPSAEGRYITDNDFRRDVTEMCRMIELDTIYTLHVNAYLQVVKLLAGDHYAYYQEAADFSRERYRIESESEADVVIANAYPLDISYTFMRKGYKPLVAAKRSAMKIMIASAYEGVGHHGLFQHLKPPAMVRLRTIYRKLATHGGVGLAKKVVGRIQRKLSGANADPNATRSRPSRIPDNSDHLWVYRTDDNDSKLPQVDDMTVLTEWSEVIEAIQRRCPNKKIRVRLYPCSPLQTVEI